METTSQKTLDLLPGYARVWIFQSSVPLVGDIRRQIESTMNTFLDGWAAHGSSLMAAFEIRHNRFLILGVDEQVASATGCSIDKMMRLIQEFDGQFNLDLLNRMKVAYFEGEVVMECDVNAFTAMLKNGEASSETKVFNNLVQNLSEFRQEWETTVGASWHSNLLP